MLDGPRGESDLRPLMLLRRAARWQARSYLQIWVMAVSGYLGCEIIYGVVVGWPWQRTSAFVTAALVWIAFGIGQSYYLHRRRTG
jgi:hypothetical protein